MTLEPLLWIDVETTGLDPLKDHLLEVGMVYTDESMRVLGQMSVVIAPEDPAALDDLWEGHEGNGLRYDVVAFGCSKSQARERIAHFLDGIPKGLRIAGSCVDFDRLWLKVALGITFDNHRHLDMNALKLFGAKHTHPKIHRALACLRADIESLREWVRARTD